MTKPKTPTPKPSPQTKKKKLMPNKRKLHLHNQPPAKPELLIWMLSVYSKQTPKKRARSQSAVCLDDSLTNNTA